MIKSLKHISKQTYFWVLLSIISYYLFAYHVERSEFLKLITLYTILFGSFLKIIYDNKGNQKFLLAIAFLFRAIFILAIPNLSNDFYRFIWDGRMIWNGMNPYLYLPENNPELITEGKLLYEGMGSMNGSHYTCYPPVNQFTFLVPAIFFAKNLLGSTIIMRLIIIIADVGTYYFGKKLLKHLSLPAHKIFYYLLNPFIILELTGNLHFEGVMICFLLGALYYLITEKTILSAFLFSLSVSVKLIPLLFLPLFYKKLKLKKSLVYFSLIGLLNILYFLPFLSQGLIDNFMKSIHLYFQNFEFNASIYYIIREIGYAVKGYNIIQTVGKITPIIIMISVLLFALFKKNNRTTVLFISLLFSITIYYTLATVVHPWYIAIPLILSIFTKYKYPLVWSFFIILSYSAYQTETYKENLILVTLEYLIVFGYLCYEVFLKKKVIHQ